ncbi:MAG: WS/DGAT domain-containing protein, partial [Pseudomonadota bacterium]
ISDSDPKGTPAVPIPDDINQPSELPTASEILNRAINSTVTSPVKLAQAFMKFAPAIVSSTQQNLLNSSEERDSSIPDTRFNRSVTPHKMFDAITFDLNELKKMRALAQGSTINDIVLAICSGAVRKYLMKHKELPKDSLVAVAPVNARSRSGEESNPGNNISAMTVKIWSNIANPVQRLKAIRDTTRETKAAKSGLSARIMTDLTKHIPGAPMSGLSRILTDERFAPKMNNLMVSNVPGPQMQLYMTGAKLTHQYGLAPLAHGMGLFIATPSYNGTISFSIISDRKIMPDIEFFRECLQKSFEELRKAKPEGDTKQGTTKRTTVKKAAAKGDAGVMYRKVSKTRRTAKQSKK